MTLPSNVIIFIVNDTMNVFAISLFNVGSIKRHHRKLYLCGGQLEQITTSK